jgi:hypothetical protein
VTIHRTLSHRRVSTIVALSAIVFAWAWVIDRALPSGELINRPDGPILCGRSSVAACEYRM